MAGIMNKIGDALHIGGGNKEGDEHKKVQSGEHKKEEEKKEGILDKIKDKVSGGEKSEKVDGEKKKKDKKKKKEGDGHEKKKKDHGGSSSSDSDSD